MHGFTFISLTHPFTAHPRRSLRITVEFLFHIFILSVHQLPFLSGFMGHPGWNNYFTTNINDSTIQPTHLSFPSNHSYPIGLPTRRPFMFLPTVHPLSLIAKFHKFTNGSCSRHKFLLLPYSNQFFLLSYSKHTPVSFPQMFLRLAIKHISHLLPTPLSPP